MHGHHDHRIGVGVVLLNVGIEGDLLQKSGERGRIAVFHVIEDAGFELSDIFGAGARFHIVLFLQHGEIPCTDKHLVIEIREAFRFQQLRALLDHDGERHELLRRFFHAGVAVGVGDDAVERQRGGLGLTLRHFDCLGADAARRIVQNAAQAQIIGAVVDEAEIRQHVLDLGAVKKARAADDAVGYAAALEGIFERV